MALPELQQAHTLLSRATRTLFIVPEHASLDAISSMIALYLAWHERANDRVDEVSPGHVPLALQFLAGSSQVVMEPEQQVEVTVDLAGPEQVAAMRSTALQGGVRVHLSLPVGTTIERSQIESTVRQLPYDLVVVFGAADLEALGTNFTSHADFFYNTPIINIDHRPNNEHFGTVNIVDITAGSVAEATYELITTVLGTDELEADVATALYAGIVAGTDSFQKPSTTPRSFQVAARLMELQADRESVIQHLVKTKPLELLKLSGRLYARLRYDEHLQLFWSLVRGIDFTESGASNQDLSTALYELSNNISFYNAAFVVSETAEQQFEVLLLLGKGLLQRRQEIQAQLTAERLNGLLRFNVNVPSIDEAEQHVLEQMRAVLP